jgi:hypothetical protein
MLSLFKKKTETSSKDQNDNKSKSSLDHLQNDLNLLNDTHMNKVGGGKSSVKSFDDLDQLNWNSSCGGTIPQ